MKTYLKLDYHDNDYVNTAQLIAKRIIYFYSGGQDYELNRTLFAKMFRTHFSNKLKQLEEYCTEAFRYYYLADSLLNGKDGDKESAYIFRDDYRIKCYFLDKINQDDSNSETVYIDIGACKYYVL